MGRGRGEAETNHPVEPVDQQSISAPSKSYKTSNHLGVGILRMHPPKPPTSGSECITNKAKQNGSMHPRTIKHRYIEVDYGEK